MLTHTISIGYNPTRTDYEEMQQILLREAALICRNAYVWVYDELGSSNTIQTVPHCHATHRRDAEEWSQPYQGEIGSEGHPVYFRQGPIDINDPDAGSHWYVVQQASTASPESPKYRVRQAFVRLLIKAMHKHGIEVNLHSG